MAGQQFVLGFAATLREVLLVFLLTALIPLPPETLKAWRSYDGMHYCSLQLSAFSRRR